MKKGDIVRFRDPVDEYERNARFVLLEEPAEIVAHNERVRRLYPGQPCVDTIEIADVANLKMFIVPRMLVRLAELEPSA